MIEIQKSTWPTHASTPDIISPSPGWVVLVRDNPMPTTASRPGQKPLIVPASVADSSTGGRTATREVESTAFIVACGPSRNLTDGTAMAAPCKPGDHVLVSRASLTTYRGKDRNGLDVVYEALEFTYIAGIIEDPIGDTPPSITVPD